MKITSLPLSTIKPYWRNPRINDHAVEAVKQSIERYGFNQPIVVDHDHVIVAGHTRYKAMQQLGASKVPCVVLPADYPTEKATEYRIADNKAAELAEWDMTKLIPELREIANIGVMQPFFGDVDLDALLAETAGAMMQLPDQGKIDAHQEQLDSKFSEASKITQADYVDVTCPHCGEDYTLSRAEIERALKRAEQQQ